MDRNGSGEPVPAAEFHGMIGRTPGMQLVYERVRKFARTTIPVLIEGETGVGKELVARAIWSCAGHGAKHVDLNCAAIAKDLVESELFGHERGAFTGALRRHVGLLAQADGGTLFLDEVSSLPLPAQAKLLRAIETGEFRPVGGERSQHARFRLIAASNENLAAAVEASRFRLDLLHRLGAARIRVPPLRERRADIQALSSAFLLRYRARHDGNGPVRISPAATQVLRSAPWPGNVRELRNVIEASAAIARCGTIQAREIHEVMSAGATTLVISRCPQPTLAAALREAEQRAIREALELANGNRSRAADLLGVSVATLYRRLAATDAGT